jgi:RNA polymerase sigma-70 factor (ECF subfamily)
MADAFADAVATLRPKLHRYCARMTGSVIDGEDALQEALVKATAARATAGAIENMEGWLFRIAHNTSLDLLRKRAHAADVLDDELVDPSHVLDDRFAASAALRTFMRLGAAQRSTVILMDVLGYSLDEIGGILDASVPAVKALLHRGRTRLRELASEPEAPVPALAPDQSRVLAAYIDRFNAGDFAAVRDMLAEEVRLDLVARTALHGKREVETYFHNYAGKGDWHFVAGTVDGRPAVLVVDPDDRDGPVRYFVLLAWTAHDTLAFIRDFRYARYALDGAVIARSIG